jgi:hypothetical protein
VHRAQPSPASTPAFCDRTKPQMTTGAAPVTGEWHSLLDEGPTRAQRHQQDTSVFVGACDALHPPLTAPPKRAARGPPTPTHVALPPLGCVEPSKSSHTWRVKRLLRHTCTRAAGHAAAAQGKGQAWLALLPQLVLKGGVALEGGQQSLPGGEHPPAPKALVFAVTTGAPPDAACSRMTRCSGLARSCPRARRCRSAACAAVRCRGCRCWCTSSTFAPSAASTRSSLMG